MDSSRIAEQLRRISAETDLEPEDWNPPCTAEEIEKAEKKLGASFPETYRKLLLLHNGTPGREFLPLDRVIDNVEELVQIHEDIESWFGPPDHVNLEEQRPGLLRDGAYRRLWIPFYDFGTGGLYCIDCDPGPKGSYGQILLYDPDDAQGVYFDSIEEWLVEYENSEGPL